MNSAVDFCLCGYPLICSKAHSKKPSSQMQDARDQVVSLYVYAQALSIDGSRYAHRRSTLGGGQDELTEPTERTLWMLCCTLLGDTGLDM